MCGIVGYVGHREASGLLLDGLRRVEYRGYDSAGLAVLNGAGLEIRRRVGKVADLVALVADQPVHGTVGLGHTRWATHGRPSDQNAHPHADCTNAIAVVHNGILENYAELKARLTAHGHCFRSETDTEVLAHLVEAHWTEGRRPRHGRSGCAPRDPRRICHRGARDRRSGTDRGREARCRQCRDRAGRRRDVPGVGHSGVASANSDHDDPAGW